MWLYLNNFGQYFSQTPYPIFKNEINKFIILQFISLCIINVQNNIPSYDKWD